MLKRWAVETARTLAILVLVLWAIGATVENVRDLMAVENLATLREVAHFVLLP